MFSLLNSKIPREVQTKMEPQVWRIEALAALCFVGSVDAIYQHFYGDQCWGRMRTTLTCLAIFLLAVDLVRLRYQKPKKTGIFCMSSDEMPNAYTLAFIGVSVSVFTMLLALCGRRCVFVWNALTNEPGVWEHD